MEVNAWFENHVAELGEAVVAICQSEHSYHYSPPGFHVDEDAHSLRTFDKLNEKFALMVVQMTGTFDTFTKQVNDKIDNLKESKKGEVDIRRRASERSLTMATAAFGEGIEFIRESVEMKAMADQDDIMTSTTSGREIIEYNLELNKNELWRSISYLAKKLYADERND